MLAALALAAALAVAAASSSASSASAAADSPSATANLVPTPFGYAPAACVHRVPSGTAVRDGFDAAQAETHLHFSGDASSGSGEADVVLRRRAECAQWRKDVAAERAARAARPSFGGPTNKTDPQGHQLGAYDGWMALASYAHKPGLNNFLGYFSVPESPKYAPTMFFIFTGLQDDEWIPLLSPPPAEFDIIQPVLQYNSDGWAVKSWYVTVTSDVVYSDPFPTEVGDNIFGNMTKIGSDTWFIGGASTKNPSQTCSLKISRPRLASQWWAQVVGECYGCDGGCNYEPSGPIQFTKLSMVDTSNKPVTPVWKPAVTPNPKCHEKSTVVDATHVTLSFQ